MSTWTHEKDALLMAMADYITGDNVAGPLKRIIAAKNAVRATPPKASAGELEDAVRAELEACGYGTDHMFAVVMHAIKAAAPFIAAERDGLVATLFAAIKHGDDEHMAWLRQAIDDHFAGRTVARAVGLGTKERVIAERDAEIERLKADITRFAMASERYRDQLIVAEQNLSLAKCDSKREIDTLRNPDIIEAAAKRAEAAFHAGGSFRWDFRRERVERWRAVARAVLTGKSEGG